MARLLGQKAKTLVEMAETLGQRPVLLGQIAGLAGRIALFMLVLGQGGVWGVVEGIFVGFILVLYGV